jgi:hypothetical protein
MGDQPRKNIYLTDENVYSPAIELAREKYGLHIIRDVDIEVPCDNDVYDICLFHLAMEQGYVLATGNNLDFEWQYYEYAETHETSGMILIQPNHARSTDLIADWLALWEEEDFRNWLVRIPPA